MARLFFVGIKHSGKTTQARLVSKLTGLAFKDADDLVLETLSGESIRDVYRREGKEAFMERELSSVATFIDANSSFILSLGGGAADNTRLMDLMKSMIFRTNKTKFFSNTRILRDSLRKAVTQQWLQEAELVNAQEGTRNEDQQSNSL